MGSGSSTSRPTKLRQSNAVAGGAPVASYENGEPDVHADEIYGCFAVADLRGDLTGPPGLLYRLVNYELNQWYFYNDTKDYNMVVTGYFGPMSSLKALGNAKMYREMPSGLLIVELVVPPLHTEVYIEGQVKDGFDLHFKALPSS